ncbi:MAG: cation:proton antiporter [Rhodospirillaceae bacterium]|nr:cation:proton antiporter [Rhodospirillaceae bacterium]|tara:strand:- start:33 stop:449 length:417 start_codon:yes stop_codon:yes gene_type:complete
MKHHTIPRVIAKLAIPGIILFGLYVQFHGDYGPGGGFQAGVIIGAAMILYGLIFGLDALKSVAPQKIVTSLIALGFLLYAGVGIVTQLLGANFLEYGVLAHSPKEGQHIGIILVEIGVGITVAAVMIIIFYMFAGRKQ